MSSYTYRMRYHSIYYRNRWSDMERGEVQFVDYDTGIGDLFMPSEDWQELGEPDRLVITVKADE